MENMSEQEQADLWLEIQHVWCHRLLAPEFDAKQFSEFIAGRLAKENE